jgi:allophanate hydrolase
MSRLERDPVERVRRACRAIAGSPRPEAWIAVRAESELLAEAISIRERQAAGEELPLAGWTLAVKDNIDVAGLPTTAGCPAYAYDPPRDAVAVARLRAAGAIVLGKTNLDQFATGLVGTRSPYGAARDVRRPDRVAGGSSSGSALAVALGEADLALGTDTAGSGRVPAAFAGLIGCKPTRGLVPTLGVVPACRTVDCVSVLAGGLDAAAAALAVIAGADPRDSGSRRWPASAPLAAPPVPRVGVPAATVLADLSPAARSAFAAYLARLEAIGAELVEVDLHAFFAAGELLYGGGFLAERYAAVGAFIDAHPEAVDPTVAGIIVAGASIPAHRLVADGERRDALRAEVDERLAGLDALALPTVAFQPTLAEVAADPVAVNARLGRYTAAVNLLDLCALAVPAGEADGGCFGVSLIARAFADLVLIDLAGRVATSAGAQVGLAPGARTRAAVALDPGETRPAVADLGALTGAIELIVIGAHRSGQPLNRELTSRGARRLGVVLTAPSYRLHALATKPPKPGLVRVDGGGVAIEGELWALPPAGLASLLATLPAPMALGPVVLAGGKPVVGFLCEPLALEGAPDISAYGSWPDYLAASGPRAAKAAAAR